jgi:hypothetical protein
MHVLKPVTYLTHNVAKLGLIQLSIVLLANVLFEILLAKLHTNKNLVFFYPRCIVSNKILVIKSCHNLYLPSTFFVEWHLLQGILLLV